MNNPHYSNRTAGVGKTTVGKALADKTGMKRLSLDGIANDDRRKGIRY